jgi:CBS domain-containing protein
MKVEELMSRDVVTCATHDDLATVAKQMWDRDCGVVPVVDADRRVVGMITDRDICMSAWMRAQPVVRLTVADAMCRQVAECSPGDEVVNALAILRERQVHRLPVTDSRGRLVGLLSLSDVARAAADARKRSQVPLETLASTLAAICEPRSGAVPTPRREPLVARQRDLEC